MLTPALGLLGFSCFLDRQKDLSRLLSLPKLSPFVSHSISKYTNW